MLERLLNISADDFCCDLTCISGANGTCVIGDVVRECTALDMNIAAHDSVLVRGKYLTLFILVDFLKHINTISMG